MADISSNPNPNPTADYRKYPKGPNFLGIVLGTCAFLIVFFVIVYFFLHRDAGKLMPHAPRRNPTPNSLLRPLPPRTILPATQG